MRNWRACVRAVVVDLAAEAGIAEGCVAGERVEKHGDHHRRGQSGAEPAADLALSRATCTISALLGQGCRQVVLPDDDELVKGVRLTSGGKVVHERSPEFD